MAAADLRLDAAVLAAHAVVRAVGSLAIWALLPEGRLTLLPFFVCAVYLASVAAILMAARREAARTA